MTSIRCAMLSNWLVRVCRWMLLRKGHPTVYCSPPQNSFCSEIFLCCLLFLCRPEIFKSTAVESSKQDNTQSHNSQMDENEDSIDDDGLPPLEANTNRLNPFQGESETESDSETDS
ncbi:hypothetical protein AABB24_005373 [Solanum stoloniferum]|uniref:Uncharacterized protein n=1 Tax=Solanum stoloniferum TaxID=62892 RepID=A0ABD2V0V0_9SOLN